MAAHGEGRAVADASDLGPGGAWGYVATILLHGYWAIYDRLSTFLVYAIHHTISG